MVDEIRENTDGVATVPINEIMRFQQGVVGPVQRILLIVAGAVVLVSCLTVLITLHQAGGALGVAILPYSEALVHPVAKWQLLYLPKAYCLPCWSHPGTFHWAWWTGFF